MEHMKVIWGKIWAVQRITNNIPEKESSKSLKLNEALNQKYSAKTFYVSTQFYGWLTSGLWSGKVMKKKDSFSQHATTFVLDCYSEVGQGSSIYCCIYSFCSRHKFY